MDLRWLQADYWQGIAGIMQILAAVAAVVTIWQARKNIEQAGVTIGLADQQRRTSVEPDWEPIEGADHTRAIPPLNDGAREIQLIICVKNCGEGPAREWQCEIRGSSGTELKHGQPYVYHCGGHGTVFKDDILVFPLFVPLDGPEEGTLTITAKTRFDDMVTWRLGWRTWLDDRGRAQYAINKELVRRDWEHTL